MYYMAKLVGKNKSFIVLLLLLLSGGSPVLIIKIKAISNILKDPLPLIIINGGIHLAVMRKVRY